MEGTRHPGAMDTPGVTPAEGQPTPCEGHLHVGQPGVDTHPEGGKAGASRVPAPTARQRVLHLRAGACGKWVRLCRARVTARGWLRTLRLP